MGNTANLHFQEWHNGSALLKSLCRDRRYANWSVVHCVIAPCVLGILMGNQNRPFIIDSRLRINHLFNNQRLKQILPVRLYWCSCVLIFPRHAQPCLTITQTFWCSRVFHDSHLHEFIRLMFLQIILMDSSHMTC